MHQAYKEESRWKMMSSSRGILTVLGERFPNDNSYLIKKIDDFDKFNFSLINFLEKDKISIQEITQYLNNNEKNLYYQFLNDDVIMFSKELNSNKINYIITINHGKVILSVTDVKEENIINFEKLHLYNKNIIIKQKKNDASSQAGKDYFTIETNGTRQKQSSL